MTSLSGAGEDNALVFVVVEKLIRISIFLGYLWLISRMKDLQRVFEYHGAEHKTISCYEAGLPLTPENAQRFSRLHPRCGTSFLLIVMIVAIFVFAPFGKLAWYWLFVSRIVGIPLVAGLAFEAIKWFGRNRSRRWARVLMWPGLQLQRLTTREPDHAAARGGDRGARGGARDESPERRSTESRRASASRSSPSRRPCGDAAATPRRRQRDAGALDRLEPLAVTPKASAAVTTVASEARTGDDADAGRGASPRRT